MFRLDHNRYGGGLVLYVNEQVPCKKLTNYENPIASEIIVLEFHQSKRKWLILGIYKTPRQKEADFLQHLSWLLDFHIMAYENIIIIGDFNMTIKNHFFKDIMKTFALFCLISKPTCFQSVNPTCVYLILTNKPNLFTLSAKGAYIKYVGGGDGGFYEFFKKCFVAQETIGLNISWPINFFRKYFMALTCNSISG